MNLINQISGIYLRYIENVDASKNLKLSKIIVKLIIVSAVVSGLLGFILFFKETGLPLLEYIKFIFAPRYLILFLFISIMLELLSLPVVLLRGLVQTNKELMLKAIKYLPIMFTASILTFGFFMFYDYAETWLGEIALLILKYAIAVIIIYAIWLWDSATRKTLFEARKYISGLIQEYKNRLGCNEKIYIIINSIDKSYNAGVFSILSTKYLIGHVLYINYPWLSDYNKRDENPDYIFAIKRLIGHELGHILYKDSILIRFFKVLLYKKPMDNFFNTLRCINIIWEIRADICSRVVAGLTPEENLKAHDYLLQKGSDDTEQNCYWAGYPTRSQRKSLSSRYDKFDETTFDVIKLEVLEPFCKVRKVKNPDRFIEKIRDYCFPIKTENKS